MLGGILNTYIDLDLTAPDDLLIDASGELHVLGGRTLTVDDFETDEIVSGTFHIGVDSTLHIQTGTATVGAGRSESTSRARRAEPCSAVSSRHPDVKNRRFSFG